jgi:hypothetical protein
MSAKLVVATIFDMNMVPDSLRGCCEMIFAVTTEPLMLATFGVDVTLKVVLAKKMFIPEKMELETSVGDVAMVN